MNAFRRLYWLLLGVVIFCYDRSFAIDIFELKGTSSILSEEDKEYLPFWGLFFYEGCIVENIYKLSSKNIVSMLVATVQSKEDKDTIKRLVDNLLLPSQQTQTEVLVSHLYTVTANVFRVSVAADAPSARLSPKDIGNVLRLIKLFLSYKDVLLAAKGDDQIYASLEDYFRVLGLSMASKDKLKIKNNFLGNKLTFIKDKLKEALLHYLVKEHIDSKVFSSRDWSQKFVNPLIGSLDECDAKNRDALYPLHTTQGILLGVLLQKAQSKIDLAEYFSAFLGKEVVLNDQDVYTAEELRLILKEYPYVFDSFINQKWSQNIISFADWSCAYMYYKYYASDLPRESFVETILYDDVKFQDCVETVLRCMCNIVTYDKVNHKMGIPPHGIQMSSELEHFYKTGKNALLGSIRNKTVHQDWSDIVENIPLVVYGNLKIKGGDICRFSGKAHYSFIPVVDIPADAIKDELVFDVEESKKFEVYKKIVNGQEYFFIPQNSNLLCYEMRPNASNFIVILNKLFMLGLDLSINQLFDTDLIVSKFQIMCEKLNLIIQQDQLEKLKQHTAPVNTYLDFIEICKNKSCFKIVFEPLVHAHLEIVNMSDIEEINLFDLNYEKYPLLIAVEMAVYSGSVNFRQSDPITQICMKLQKDMPMVLSKLLKYAFYEQPVCMNNVQKETVGINILRFLLGLKDISDQFHTLITKLILVEKDIDTILYYVAESNYQIGAIVVNSLQCRLDIIKIKNGDLSPYQVLCKQFFKTTDSDLKQALRAAIFMNQNDFENGYYSAISLLDVLVVKKLDIDCATMVYDTIFKGLGINYVGIASLCVDLFEKFYKNNSWFFKDNKDMGNDALAAMAKKANIKLSEQGVPLFRIKPPKPVMRDPRAKRQIMVAKNNVELQ